MENNHTSETAARAGPATCPEPITFRWNSHDGLNLHGVDWLPDPSVGADLPPLLCLPGLSRNTKDFRGIARFLQRQGLRVIALDYRGRGQSDWDPEWHNYAIPIEGHDIDAAIDHLDLQRFSILGTSRGGIHAMAMAERFGRDRIAAIALNDIGPHIEMKAIHRIAATLGKTMSFPSKAVCGERLKSLLGLQFPKLSRDNWIHLAEQLGAETPGDFRLEYDPALGKTLALNDEAAPIPDLWPLFETIAPIPALVLRGEHSDLLSKETCQKMTEMHPGTECLTVPDEGHAPLLWDEPTQSRILQFLARHS